MVLSYPNLTNLSQTKNLGYPWFIGMAMKKSKVY